MKTEEKDPLLTREEFKKQVFAKADGMCCVPGCTCKAVDAHHIMDRKLWKDGGYYLTNGAALCSEHHIEAEHGKITPRLCFEYMGQNIQETKIPDKIACYLSYEEYIDLLRNDKINKWGE